MKKKKFKLFKIKHTILLEGETFLRNKQKIAFFLNKVQIFLVAQVNVKNISFLKLEKHFLLFTMVLFTICPSFATL